MAGEGQEKPWPPKFLRNRRIFGNFNVSLETFWSFAVGKDRGFECYRKYLNLAPLLYKCQDASAHKHHHKKYNRFEALKLQKLEQSDIHDFFKSC